MFDTGKPPVANSGKDTLSTVGESEKGKKYGIHHGVKSINNNRKQLGSTDPIDKVGDVNKGTREGDNEGAAVREKV